jgi:hypothetical protein
MAKKKPVKKSARSGGKPRKPEKVAVEEVKTSDKPRDFFSSLKEGFKAAGETAERYARMGISAGQLEKLRLQLKMAYSRLGEGVAQCWDAAPDIGVTAADSAVRAQAKEVNDLRRKIREIEVRLRTLKQG